MTLDLNQCSRECWDCIRGYKTKHSLEHGETFDIKCNGIPNEEMVTSVLEQVEEKDRPAAHSILDPVAWAARVLDWHCLDPDGEIWKRKNRKEYDNWVRKHPGEDISGHSRYHRPWQALALRCSSKRKVFRCGRQLGKSEVLVVAILFHLLTQPNADENTYTAIVIAPYQSQVDLLFTRINQLIRQSAFIQNSIMRSVKAPIYQIEFYNGSIVKGFTAGTRSAGNAEAVRGQHGNLLLFDESDFLSPADLDAALSIITNFPEASVWMSSTPSGKREKFFQTCWSKNYKEFYYPSQMNPLWDETLETLYREQLTEIGYNQEVLALFSEQEQGVFQNAYVQAAKTDYEYTDMSYQHTWRYTFGVDWNDVKNGSTIVVLGFNPATNTFFVVDRRIVSREGWNQLTACQTIADMNRIWHPVSIYIDSGFGGVQGEVLRKFGYDSLIDPTKGAHHPDAKLRNIVKAYDFGSKVEVRDLWTKQLISKDSKPFLVECAMRRFEKGDIKFPKHDVALEKQLLGYIIDHVTITGRPVYKAGDVAAGDHLLDALMLSIVAFTMEQTPLGKPTYSSTIAFSGRIGEKMGPEPGPGDTVIIPDRKHKIEEARASNRPEGNRWDDSPKFTPDNGLPASNLNTERSTVKIWSWPGFGHDAPAPVARTLKQAFGDAAKRTGHSRSRSSRPSRKNI